MLVFIDESGDTGLKINSGASNFFIIVLVVFKRNEEAIFCDKQIFTLRRQLHLKANFEFHFYANSDRVREQFFNTILPGKFSYYCLVINKQQLESSDEFKDKESFYKYACGLLFAGARDRLCDATVVIDESGRKLFKYQLAKYLRNKVNIDGKKIIKKVKMQNSKNNNLLQLADMVAGAINRSLTYTKKQNNFYRNLIKSKEKYFCVWP